MIGLRNRIKEYDCKDIISSLLSKSVDKYLEWLNSERDFQIRDKVKVTSEFPVNKMDVFEDSSELGYTKNYVKQRDRIFPRGSIGKITEFKENYLVVQFNCKVNKEVECLGTPDDWKQGHNRFCLDKNCGGYRKEELKIVPLNSFNEKKFRTQFKIL